MSFLLFSIRCYIRKENALCVGFMGSAIGIDPCIVLRFPFLIGHICVASLFCAILQIVTTRKRKPAAYRPFAAVTDHEPEIGPVPTHLFQKNARGFPCAAKPVCCTSLFKLRRLVGKCAPFDTPGFLLQMISVI